MLTVEYLGNMEIFYNIPKKIKAIIIPPAEGNR